MTLEKNPLVTLAVLGYNQEKYIREAIKGALSQTYKHLEIIFSDDCSSDRTFELMQNSILNYSPDIKVILNKNEINFGIGGHLKRIAELATGDIIILAAGDDFSNPDRVEKVVSYFCENPTKYAVFTDIEIISDEGRLISSSHGSWRASKKIKIFDLARRGGGVGTGASYAYRKECFSWPSAYPECIMNEDRILPWRAFFLGGVGYISCSLVKYRHSKTGVSRTLSTSEILAATKDVHIEELKVTVEAAYDDRLINENQKMRALKGLSELKLYKLSQLAVFEKYGSLGKIFSFLKTGYFSRHWLKF
jgi:glycosyltransferase involved in cell wall biosynthesis